MKEQQVLKVQKNDSKARPKTVDKWRLWSKFEHTMTNEKKKKPNSRKACKLLRESKVGQQQQDIASNESRSDMWR